MVVGLDPDYALLPPVLRDKHEALAYDDEIAEARGGVPRVPVSPADRAQVGGGGGQAAAGLLRGSGAAGVSSLRGGGGAAHSLGYLVIADAKRGDIGSSAEAYAAAHLDLAGADAITVNPWFGGDGLEPFLRRARDEGKGVFVLVKTSNPGSADLQDQRAGFGPAGSTSGWPICCGAGRRALWAASGYSNVGAVVGATYPAQAAELRPALPGVPFLVPGYGAQGATAADVAGRSMPRGPAR